MFSSLSCLFFFCPSPTLYLSKMPALWWQSRLLARTIILPATVTGVLLPILASLARGWLFWRALISFLKWPTRRSTICLSGELRWMISYCLFLLRFEYIFIQLWVARMLVDLGERLNDTPASEMTILIGRWIQSRLTIKIMLEMIWGRIYRFVHRWLDMSHIQMFTVLKVNRNVDHYKKLRFVVLEEWVGFLTRVVLSLLVSLWFS